MNKAMQETGSFEMLIGFAVLFVLGTAVTTAVFAVIGMVVR